MVTQSYIDKVAQLESGGDPLAKNPNSTAKGLFQFINDTGNQYGLNNYEFGTKEYTQAETEAFKTFSDDNYKALESGLGRPPTDGELYLAHQQGASGAEKLLNNPNEKAIDILGRDAVLNNGGDENMLAYDFSKKWTDKFKDSEDNKQTDSKPLLFSIEQIDAELKERGASIEDKQKESKTDNVMFSVSEIDEELIRRGEKKVLSTRVTEGHIRDIEEKININKQGSSGMLGRMYTMALEREKKINETKAIAEKNGVPYANFIPQLGEAAAFIGDVGFELVVTGARSVSPDFVDFVGDNVGWAVSSVAKTAPAAFVGEKYTNFKEENPLIAENIEGGLGVAMFLYPTAKVVSVEGKASLETAKKLSAEGVRPAVVIDTKKRALTRILKASDKTYGELLDSLKTSDVLTIADVAGDEVQGLTRSLGKMKGAKNVIHDILTKRTNSSVERVSNILSQRVSNVDTYFGHIEEMVKTRSAAARPLYKKAFEETLSIDDPRLKKFLEDKRIKDAIITAKTKYGVRLEAAENSLESLDGVKKVLYDLESKAKVAGEKNLSGAYKDLRQSMVEILDDASPTYKKARAVFEHSSKLIDAQESGRAFQKLRPEQLTKLADKMSADELEAYRIGVREKLQEIVSKTQDGSDPARRIFGNTEKRGQLKAIFSDDTNYLEFSKRMEDEIQTFKTRNTIIGGSRTDYNLASDLGFIDAASDAVRRGVIDTAIDKTIDAVTNAVRKYYVGISDKNAESIALILLDRNKGIEALQELMKTQDEMIQRAAVTNAIKNHGVFTMIDGVE